jgi:hypothetical protein
VRVRTWSCQRRIATLEFSPPPPPPPSSSPEEEEESSPSLREVITDLAGSSVVPVVPVVGSLKAAVSEVRV